MDEQTLLHLVSRAVGHILLDIDAPWTTEQRKEISERLADVAWRGLILMMRQTLASGASVVLNEVGRFERNDSGWSFQPAASLAEAAALPLPWGSAYADLARQTMFHLEQASELVNKIPVDIEVLVPLSQEADQTAAILAVPPKQQRLSDVAHAIAVDIAHSLLSLAARTQDSTPTLKAAREYQGLEPELAREAEVILRTLREEEEDRTDEQQSPPTQPREPREEQRDKGKAEERTRDRPKYGDAGAS